MAGTTLGRKNGPHISRWSRSDAPHLVIRGTPVESMFLGLSLRDSTNPGMTNQDLLAIPTQKRPSRSERCRDGVEGHRRGQIRYFSGHAPIHQANHFSNVETGDSCPKHPSLLPHHDDTRIIQDSFHGIKHGVVFQHHHHRPQPQLLQHRQPARKRVAKHHACLSAIGLPQPDTPRRQTPQSMSC
jgi:hypothetical protein